MRHRKLLYMGISVMVIVALVYLITLFPYSERDAADAISVEAVLTDGSREERGQTPQRVYNRGDHLTVHIDLARLEQSGEEQDVLCFALDHCRMVAYLGGSDIYTANDWTSRNGVNYCRIPLPYDGQESEMTLDITVGADRCVWLKRDFVVYSARESYRFFIDGNRMGFLISFSIFGMCVMLLTLVLMQHRRNCNIRCAFYLALCMLALATWMLERKGYYQMIFTASPVWNYIGVFSLFLMEAALTAYLRASVRTEHEDNVMLAFTVFNIAGGLVAALLMSIDFQSALEALRVISALVNAALLVSVGVLRVKRAPDSDTAGFTCAALVAAALDIAMAAICDAVPAAVPAALTDVLETILPLLSACFCIFALGAFYLEIEEATLEGEDVEANLTSMRGILWRLPAGICIFRDDVVNTLITANESFYKLLNYTPELAAATGFRSVVFPLDDVERTRFYALLQNTKAAPDGTGTGEFYARDVNGRRGSFLFRMFYDAPNRRFIGSVFDVSANRRAEEALRVSEMSYKLALENSGRNIFYLDVPTHTQHYSPELSELFLMPTVLGQVPQSLIAGGYVSADSAAAITTFYCRIYAGEAHGEIHARLRLNQPQEAYCWCCLRFNTVFDDAGLPYRAVITCDDITAERERAIASAWQMRNLVAQPENGYVVLEWNLITGELRHQQGGMTAPLPSEMRNYDAAMADMAEHVVAEEDVVEFSRFTNRAALLQRQSEGMTDCEMELRVKRESGDAYWVRLLLQLIRDPDSNETLCQMTYLDIDREKTGSIHLEQSLLKLQTELENSRIKVMINQMQPHFLYNALSAIRTLVKTNPPAAYDLLYDFSLHLRGSVRALSSDAPISFEDEIKNVRAYLNIENMRLAGLLHVEYVLTVTDFFVVPFTVQPLAENAVRHGVFPKGRAGGTVKISSFETEQSYIIEVEDDGAGFDVDAVLNHPGDSVGLKNVIYRLRTLMGAEVKIRSVPGKGTCVSIIIPAERAVGKPKPEA